MEIFFSEVCHISLQYLFSLSLSFSLMPLFKLFFEFSKPWYLNPHILIKRRIWKLPIGEKFNEYRATRYYVNICGPVKRDVGSSFVETRWIYWRFNATRDVYRSAINKLERAITSDRNVPGGRRALRMENIVLQSLAQKCQFDGTDYHFPLT